MYLSYRLKFFFFTELDILIFFFLIGVYIINLPSKFIITFELKTKYYVKYNNLTELKNYFHKPTLKSLEITLRNV